MPNEWLVRSKQNQITGPWDLGSLIQRIRSGEFHLQDEVCKANHYWFFLHETEEVLKFLGIEPPQSQVTLGDETTDPGTGTKIIDPANKTSISQIPLAQGPILQNPSQRNWLKKVDEKVERQELLRGSAWLLAVITVLVLLAILKILGR